jgi:hypothetical protein
LVNSSAKLLAASNSEMWITCLAGTQQDFKAKPVMVKAGFLVSAAGFELEAFSGGLSPLAQS